MKIANQAQETLFEQNVKSAEVKMDRYLFLVLELQVSVYEEVSHNGTAENPMKFSHTFSR